METFDTAKDRGSEAHRPTDCPGSRYGRAAQVARAVGALLHGQLEASIALAVLHATPSIAPQTVLSHIGRWYQEEPS